MCLVKVKDKSKYLSKRYSTLSKVTKAEFCGMMMRLSYLLNQLINTNVSVNMKE